jgi:hypothetical protein
MFASVALRFLRVYLGLFTLFAPDREHAHLEHALIEWSLREMWAEFLEHGVSPFRAAALVLYRHIGELDPLTLAFKTRDDARCTEQSARRPTCRVRRVSMVGSAASAVAVAVLLAWDAGVPEVGRPLTGAPEAARAEARQFIAGFIADLPTDIEVSPQSGAGVGPVVAIVIPRDHLLHADLMTRLLSPLHTSDE